MINEHDMTKKMMEIMRGGYKSILTEVEDPQTQMNQSSEQVAQTDLDQTQEAPLPKDAIELQKNDSTYQDELQKMREVVTQTVNFTSFNIYPSDENVVIDGYLEKRESDNSGIFFKMALTSGDIETSMVDVELNDAVNETMKRLTGYYANFSEEWGKKIHEYKNSNG